MSDINGKEDYNDSPDFTGTSSPASYKQDSMEILPSTPQRVRQYFQTEVRNSHVDIVILLCWFVTGLLDGTIFNAYRTFVSMQTGNTMFLGLGASNFSVTTRPYAWAKSLTSMIFFLAGCYSFPRFSRRFGPLRRGTLVTSFSVQFMLILIPAIIVQTNVVEGRLEHIGEDIDFRHLIPIALLSFQAPGQLCLCRDMSLLEVPSLVVTTVLYDFAADPNLMAPWTKNPARNRRFLGFAMILMGAIAGGWVSKSTGHITITLWATSGIKFIIAVAWVFWPAKRESARRWAV